MKTFEGAGISSVSKDKHAHSKWADIATSEGASDSGEVDSPKVEQAMNRIGKNLRH